MSFLRKNRTKLFLTLLFVFVFLVLPNSSSASTADSLDTCKISYFTGFPEFSFACVRYFMALAIGWVIWGLAALTSVASIIFTYVVDISINSIASFADIPAVIGTWRLLRDMVNMFALMIMLYIAIGTILQLDGVNWKKMIGQMIIAVILINFSMAITGFIIDTSNVFAVYFYDKARGGEDGDITTKLVAQLNIAGQINSGEASTGEVTANAVPSTGAIITNGLGTLIIMIGLIFVMITGSVLFVVRTVKLIFALIFSPLPWIAMIIPKYGSKLDTGYWQDLMNQALFAPVFTFCLYLTMQVVACGDLIGTLLDDTADIPVLGGTGNAIFFNVIVLGFLLSSIVAAKKMGAAGAASAEKIGKWATGTAVAGVGAIAGIGAGTAMSVGRGGMKGAEGQEGGRIVGTLKNIREDLYKNVGKPTAEKISTKAGMLTSSIKEAGKSPLSLIGNEIKAASGLDILPTSADKKESEKAEKEYKAKQAVEKDKNRIAEIAKIETLSDEKYNQLTTEEKKKYDEQQENIEKEVKGILEKFRGEKVIELGLKNLKVNNGLVGKWMNEAQLKAVENHSDTKPEDFRIIQDAVYDNERNMGGRRYVETSVVQRRWNEKKKDAAGNEINVWSDKDKEKTIKNMSSKNIAELSEEILLDKISINSYHADDIKKIREIRGANIANKIKASQDLPKLQKDLAKIQAEISADMLAGTASPDKIARKIEIEKEILDTQSIIAS